MSEANRQKMEQGRQATVVAAVVADVVEDHINNCVVELVRMYRGGEMDHDMLIGRVAEIAAMQSLINDLETRQRIGEVAAQKEFSNA